MYLPVMKIDQDGIVKIMKKFCAEFLVLLWIDRVCFMN